MDVDYSYTDKYIVPRLPKGKQPRRNQDRSKYKVHQGNQECVRRLAQILEGKLEATDELKDQIRTLLQQTFAEQMGLTGEPS